MQYSVKGITFFEEELSTIRLEELKVDSISPCHLFAFIKTTPFLLLRAGDYIDQEFIDKYKAKGVESFRSLPVADSKDIAEFKQLFSKLRSARTQREKFSVRDEIILLFGDHYWRETDRSFLSFVSVCYDEFYRLPISKIQKLQASSMIIYSRALISSAISIMACITDSILEKEFLEDIYNASFMTDYALTADGELSFLLTQACEHERNRPGSGMVYLERYENASVERQLFFNHPRKSAEAALECAQSFNFPEIIEHISYHHEKTDGSGFPMGISYSGLAQNETILMFADHMVPFEEYIFQTGDGSKVVKKAFIALSSLEARDLLPINRCVEKWESSMDWVINSSLKESEEVKPIEGAA